MYDDEVFADRFCYQLTMFEMHILIGLSRRHHDHIAYEIVLSKIATANLHVWKDISHAGSRPLYYD